MNTPRLTTYGLIATALSLLTILSCQATSPSANSTTANATTSSTLSPRTGPTNSGGANTSTATAPNPCYVQVWEDENYQDDNDVIYGPGKWNNMRNLPGANKGDWGDEIDSLKVGPTATVTVWEDENYGDNSQTYGPGTEKTNLRGSPDMGDTIDSMEIKCN